MTAECTTLCDDAAARRLIEHTIGFPLEKRPRAALAAAGFRPAAVWALDQTHDWADVARTIVLNRWPDSVRFRLTARALQAWTAADPRPEPKR